MDVEVFVGHPPSFVQVPCLNSTVHAEQEISFGVKLANNDRSTSSL
jgi:hypothetical protein